MPHDKGKINKYSVVYKLYIFFFNTISVLNETRHLALSILNQYFSTFNKKKIDFFLKEKNEFIKQSQNTLNYK